MCCANAVLATTPFKNFDKSYKDTYTLPMSVVSFNVHSAPQKYVEMSVQLSCPVALHLKKECQFLLDRSQSPRATPEVMA
jgi:hypothetical protein